MKIDYKKHLWVLLGLLGFILFGLSIVIKISHLPMWLHYFVCYTSILIGVFGLTLKYMSLINNLYKKCKRKKQTNAY